MRNMRLVLIVILGLSGGYLAMDRLMAPSDRVEVAMALFARYCLPIQRGETVTPETELVRLDNLPMNGAWGDDDSRMMVQVTNKRCSVSDILDPLSPEDRDRFQALAQARIPAAFPQLRPDLEESEGWDLFLTWIEHSRDDPRYWVVGLNRWAKSGDQSGTTLWLALPIE